MHAALRKGTLLHDVITWGESRLSVGFRKLVVNGKQPTAKIAE